MSTVVRMYDAEENARNALQLLAGADFGSNEVFHFQPDAGDPTEVISRAIESGLIPSRYGKACRDALAHGHHVIAVLAAFGTGQMAEELMDSCGPVNTDQLVEYSTSASGPVLSDLLGWSPLSRRKHVMTSRVSRGWTLSGTIGLKTKTKGGTPLSSMLGMNPLTKPKSKTSSFGMPLLSRKGTMFGFNAIKREHPERFDSFGIPLISHDPTPLSSMFGLKVLSKKDD